MARASRDVADHRTPPTTRTSRFRARHPGVALSTLVALISAVVLLLLTVDALLREPGAIDYRQIDWLQDIEFAGLDPAMRFISELTGSFWAIGLWAALLVFLAAGLRLWLPALMTAAIPLAGGVNWIIRHGVDRPKPDPELLYRPGENTGIASFPSGHVVGAVMLWGYVFYLAGGIRRPTLRYLVRAVAGGVLLTSGFSRVWLGTHWVTDVVAGYALGALLLVVLVGTHRKLHAAVGDIPFIHAAPVPHDENRPHAHALTSTILFEPDRVIKVYAPGFVPRALYWLAFQAEFPYLRNEAALWAAVHRRNLAGMLTEYWYGESRVARALGVERAGERLGLASQRIDVVDEPDRQAAHDFLFDLADRFDAAGLPTWQIDPRQPRGKDNVLQSQDGRLYIVDLESGLISLLASPRAWLRGIRRADVPLFDTVYFDITREYVEGEQPRMTAAMGAAWYADLLALLDQADMANREWHASEPRIWSRGLGWVTSGFGLPGLVRRARGATAGGREHAEHWIATTVDAWEHEGRLTPAQAVAARKSVAAPKIKRVLPHFGVHLAIGIATRFPVGSILRASYALLNLLAAFFLLLGRRIDREEWRLRRSIHSPLVILVAGMPGIGTFAYLLSGPIRSNHLLVRMVLDAVLLKLPGDIYERFGWRSIIAYRVRSEAVAAVEVDARAASFALQPMRIAFGLACIGAALVALDVVTQTATWFFDIDAHWWDRAIRMFDADNQGALLTWYRTVLLGLAALISLVIAATLRRRGATSIAFWEGLGLLALIVSFEEHNPGGWSVVHLTRAALEGNLGISSWAGALLAMLAGALLAVLCVRFLRSMPLEIRGLLILGIGLYAGGALGMETAGWIYRRIFDDQNLLYQTMTSVEEFFEVAGVIVVFWSILEYAGRTFGEIRLRLSP